MPGGRPIQATAPDASTVVMTYAAPSGAGIGLLDMFPILPRHKLEAALKAGTLAKTWNTGTAPGDRGPGSLRAARVQAG